MSSTRGPSHDLHDLTVYPGHHAAERPDALVYIMEPSGVTVTYRELEDDSNRIARLFAQAGLRPGDNVSLQIENHPLALKIIWAAQRSGLYYTAISTSLKQDEVAVIVDDCDARVHLASARFADVAVGIVSATPRVERRYSIGGDLDGHESLEASMSTLPSTPIAGECEGGDMLYSSGTTGRPKGVKPELTFEPFGTAPPFVRLIQLMWGFGPDTVYLSPAPLYHAAPLRFMLGVTRLGGTIVMMESWDTEAALALIERHRVTHAQFVPTMLIRMLKLPRDVRERYDISSLEFVVHAAAPCPVEVKRQMMDWFGPVIHEYYGGTEGNGLTAISPQEWLDHPGSVGRPLLGQVHIVGEDGNELPAGEVGAVYFGEGPRFSYHKDPAKTEAAHNARGWSTMGDVGYVDDEGFLFLSDRKDYVIITGGVNVYPQEAENVLAVHPLVADAAVFGIPDEEFGEQVKAVVQPVEGASPGPELEAQLIAYCREQLSAIKCPRSIDFATALPRTATGKLLKREIRAAYLT